MNEKNIMLEKNIENNTNDINYLRKIKEIHLSEIKTYKKEFMKLNEILMDLFHNYNLNFISNSKDIYSVSIKNKLEEFNNYVIQKEKEINFYTFPKLHQLLESENKLSINYKKIINKNIDNKHQLNISKIHKKIFEGVSEGLKPFKSNGVDNSLLKSFSSVNNFIENEKINNKNGNILSRKELEKMGKDKIIEHCILLNEKIKEIEIYIQKYNDINFENEENKKQIIYLNSNLNKLKKDLEEQIKINFNNKVVIISQNRTIEKYKKNYEFKNILKEVDDKEKYCLSLSLSPQKTKKSLHYNKSSMNLKINKDLVYNKDLINNKKYNIFLSNKKDNNSIKKRKIKEIQVNNDYYCINSDNQIINNKNLYNNNLQTKISSPKSSNSKSNIFKSDFASSYTNFHSQN